jgi:FMN-dependent NADH-azoreductase
VRNILHIIASPRNDSYSTQLAEAFFEMYRETRSDDRIEVLDVFQANLPPFVASASKAKYSLLAGQSPRDDEELAWQPVIETINHFKSFDGYVVSCPMWNFSIPYRLKQYIDVIVQPALTFTFEPEKGYVGLVSGRPMALLLARGGAYQSGNPLETFDFQESYLRSIFGFIGFTDVRSVVLQSTFGQQEELAEAMPHALTAARSMAREFAA